MSAPCLVRQEFDSEVFGLPYYRMARFEPETLAAELEALNREHQEMTGLPGTSGLSGLSGLSSMSARFMVDAKLPAEQVDEAKALMGLGFRKVCVQAHFALESAVRNLTPSAGEPFGAVPAAPEVLDLHAANLRRSRFGLDPSVPEALRFAHQRQWLANSMASDTVRKFFAGSGFVSFTAKGGVAAIDLFSVPERRKGQGSVLLDRLKTWCADQGIPRLVVTTECENTPACLFYEKNGFRLAGTTTVFHLLQGAFA